MKQQTGGQNHLIFRVCSLGLIFLLASLFVSCGIEEYYYLPQIPEIAINRNFNDDATLTIPQIPPEFYYATGYKIFYRIYLSDNHSGSWETMNTINNSLVSDYNAFLPLTDPTDLTSIISANTFSNRGYHELDYIFDDKSGGTLRIHFPTLDYDIPIITLNGGASVPLLRSRALVSPAPIGNLYFQNTPELSNENATSEINADVASGSGDEYAYAAMYIVIVGNNPENFTRIFGKPTFINVFKLTDSF